MLVAGQWLAWGGLGTASIVAATFAITSPPPAPAGGSEPAVPVVQAAASASPATCVWPMVGPECGSATGPVRVIRVAALDRSGTVAAIPLPARPALAKVAAREEVPALRLTPTAEPVARPELVKFEAAKSETAKSEAAAKADRTARSKTAKRYVGPVREARRTTSVRVSLGGAAPVAAPRPQVAAFVVGPRFDR